MKLKRTVAESTFERVWAFHKAFNLPVKDGLAHPSDIALRIRLIEEELAEVKEALTIWQTEHTPDSVLQIAKELADLDYVVNGAFVAFGLPGNAIAQEVHVSNMTKLNELGQPVYRADGKVLKSSLYREPNLGWVLDKERLEFDPFTGVTYDGS